MLKGLSNFNDLMAKMGLELLDENGGRLLPDTVERVTRTTKGYDVHFSNHGTMMVSDAEKFLSTLKLTESSLKVKLFV